jgi:tetratricopeptide (TPR) repeat protein
MGRAEDAKSTYESALKFDSQNADLYYNIGVVDIELGNVDQALQDFDAALQVNDLFTRTMKPLLLDVARRC